jgi:hypothetical protein
MSAIWLASAITYHLHPDSLQSFSIVVAELVSSKSNNAQKLTSDSLFGHTDPESSGMELDKFTEDEHVELHVRNNKVNMM